jgi:hypothetical protein
MIRGDKFITYGMSSNHLRHRPKCVILTTFSEINKETSKTISYLDNVKIW